ncbi:GNAT family N-acetyltransferase [Aerococcus sanguinicola]|uniref:GNAT family N-acetyltransferase n=2 Tax=Aerococcaceae TaxID=186827 RepID=A0A5N1GI36_9LACT|nr:GNAT family N-acetyltransferase [Aerococcus sanguinicola]
MTPMFHFSDLYSYASHYEPTDVFDFLGNPQLADDYETNCLQLAFMPGAEELAILEDIFLDYAEEVGLTYYSFYLPENHGIPNELMAALEAKNYQLASYQVFQSPAGQIQLDNQLLNWEKVSQAENLQAYLDFQKPFDQVIDPALRRSRPLRYQMAAGNPWISQFLAYQDGRVVATWDLIDQGQFLEIDNLTVGPDYRRQGLASQIIQLSQQKAQQAAKPLLALADIENPSMAVFEGLGFKALSLLSRIHRPIS